MQDIVTLISTVGFPIAACLGMGWYITKTQESLRKVVEENTKAVLLLTERLQKGIENNESKRSIETD